MTERETAVARGLLQVNDRYVKTWMGGEYTIEKPTSVGDLKLIFRGIIDDLPVDDELRISEVWCHQNTISVTMEDGIVE